MTFHRCLCTNVLSLCYLMQFFVENPNIEIIIFLVNIFMPYGANTWGNAPQSYIAHAQILRIEISKKKVTER